MVFYTSDIERNTKSADYLIGSYASTIGSQCFLVGSGPSLFENYTKEEVDRLAASSIPKVSMNYGGFSDFEGWRVWPDIWTTYDPTNRFSAEVMWSPRTVKFFCGGRVQNLISSSTYKVCDAPQTYFFDSQNKSYADYFGVGPILDSRDSFLQAVDIAVRLGFKHIYCVGVDLRIKPSQALLDVMTAEDVPHRGLEGVILNGTTYSDKLWDYLNALSVRRKCPLATTITSLEKSLGRFDVTHRQYCCEESKSLAKALTCDNHYWDTVQYLRQARRSLANAGVTLYCEAQSRLAPYFPVVNPATVKLGHGITIPPDSTIGKYSGDIPSQSKLYEKDISPYKTQPKTVKEAIQQRNAVPVINEEA